jgi:hypothetical protein
MGSRSRAKDINKRDYAFAASIYPKKVAKHTRRG